MEEKPKFTLKLTRGQQAQVRKLAVFGIAAVVLIVLAIVLGSLAGKASAKKKSGNNTQKDSTEQTSGTGYEEIIPSETASANTEPTTQDPNDPYPASDKYPAGRYVVYATNDNGLNVRSAPSVDAERVGHLEEGESVDITKVVEVKDGADTTYWGQFKIDSTSFGYVSMTYMKAAE